MALLVLGSVASTMDVAREMLKLGQVSVLASGAIEPEGIVALDQTDGRGQRGRNWYSKPGEGLCATYLLPIKHKELKSAGNIAIMAGVAVVKSLSAMYDVDTSGAVIAEYGQDALEGNLSMFGLKWPNDVLLHGKKIGGILIEAVPFSKGEMVALVGIGINIENRRFPPDLADKSTSLVLEGLHQRPPQVLANSILQSLHHCAGMQESMGFAATLIEWRRYDTTCGRKYRVDTDSGPVTAVAEGVDDNGALIVQAENGSKLTVNSATSINEF